jgi:FKBP-type peptidyl-prolyl cis-trans isomerase FkpA
MHEPRMKMSQRVWMAVATVIAATVTVPLAAAEGAADKSAAQSADEKALYALGVMISRNLETFQLSPAEFTLLKKGLNDGFNQRVHDLDISAASSEVQALQRERAPLFAKQQQEAGQAYLDKAAALPGAQKTTSGLVMIPIRAGTGATPAHNDRVSVNYEGKLIDGTVFDSSIKRGQPASFIVSSVIPCWSEALQLMKVGEKSRLICPPNLAYGERGASPAIRPQSTLDFQVELLQITTPAAASTPAAPATPNAPGGGGTSE